MNIEPDVLYASINELIKIIDIISKEHHPFGTEIEYDNFTIKQQVQDKWSVFSKDVSTKTLDFFAVFDVMKNDKPQSIELSCVEWHYKLLVLEDKLIIRNYGGADGECTNSGDYFNYVLNNDINVQYETIVKIQNILKRSKNVRLCLYEQDLINYNKQLEGNK